MLQILANDRHCFSSLLLAVFVTTTVSAQAPSTARSGQGEIDTKFTFARLWKGQELWPFAGEGHGKFAGSKDPNEWQSMGGVSVSFNYSGTGPLPAPKELVIKLDKPVPYGPAYRLFVKNFYRGKMEAKLGDVTRPVEVKRFDWSPGASFEPNTQFNQIVLRYFPTDIVADTGVKQEQHYIVQGVFLTTDANKVPVKAGEILETVPQEKPPARAGNYLDNGSFEVGLFPWGKPFGVSAAYGPDNLDDASAAHGKSSFKRTLDRASGVLHDGGDELILETRNYRLPPGPYTLSFQAKGNKPARLHARLNGVTEDLKSDAGTPLAKSVELTGQWQQYSVSADIQALAGFLYSLKFSISSREPATVWLDAVQLQNGPLTKFQPGHPTEVGYVCSTPGHIFYEGQGSNVDLLVHDAAGKPQATVSYRVVDYWGQEVAKGQKQVPIAGHGGRLALALPAQKKGIFRLLLTAGDSTSEMIYAVVPANSHLESKYVAGTLGVDAAFADKPLTILKRANFNWVISKHLARWARTEREPGKYEFRGDAEIAAAERARMMVVLQPLNLDWDAKTNQKWLWPSFRPAKQTGLPWKQKDIYLKAWGKFVHEVVNHYKKTVKHWEIENEPNAVYMAEEYAQLLQVAIDNARRADPQARIVAGVGGGYHPEYYETMLQTVGPDKIDVLSLHIYGNTAEQGALFAPLVKKYNKPAWNTETGATCPTFFTTLPEYEQFRTKDYWENLQREVRRVTVISLHNYLLSLSVARMEKYFHYFGRFVNCGPSQPTSRFGGGKEIVEFDGSLRANGVALCIASHFIDGASYHGPVQLDPRLQVHVYQKGNGSVGFLWGRAEQTLQLMATDGLSFFDIMGNPIADKTLSVTDSPIYFTFKGDAPSCQTRLKGLKVTPRHAGAE